MLRGHLPQQFASTVLGAKADSGGVLDYGETLGIGTSG
jgi:hypothetical protein